MSHVSKTDRQAHLNLKKIGIKSDTERVGQVYIKVSVPGQGLSYTSSKNGRHFCPLRENLIHDTPYKRRPVRPGDSRSLAGPVDGPRGAPRPPRVGRGRLASTGGASRV